MSVGHIFAGIAELMDDAVLNFRLGKNSFNGSGKPVKLSVQAMKMSSIPRFFRLFSTVAQYLALSFSPTHMPKTSFLPSRSMPMAIYTAFFTI